MVGPRFRVTYIGGPTALLEVGGLRLLTDPTFDPAGSEYPTSVYTLRKTQGPAVSAEQVGVVDAVLLSHDHHSDNLDNSGRALVSSARRVITTPTGADRLGAPVIGLEPWQSLEIPTADGGVLRVTSTPARHGPTGGDRGPVTGFVLELVGQREPVVYITGDTVWYEGVAEVARRFAVDAVLLFDGAARVPEVGPEHLTFDAHEAVTLARAFPAAVIVPLHYEGWEHFSEGRPELERAFDTAGIASRLVWLRPGEASELGIAGHA
jgi:L-ascorbate metabolism protein UlaG (beta-lactamase superfamily)